MGKRADAILECRPESVGAGRRFVAGALASWGLLVGDPAWGTMSDVTLVVSELLGNAVKACSGPLILTLLVDHRIRVEVRDDNPEPARVLPSDPYALGGRGLAIVATVATTWGQDRCSGRQDGKIVWAELPIPPGSVLGEGRTLPSPTS